MKLEAKLPMNKKKLETAYLDIAIPQNAENLQLPDPSLLQFYKNYENRILWIDDEITTMTLEYAKMIMQWNFEDKQNNIPKESRTPIKVIFFSPGGDLEVNNCLVDTIQLSETPVIGINVGMAASSGCFIYLAGLTAAANLPVLRDAAGGWHHQPRAGRRVQRGLLQVVLCRRAVCLCRQGVASGFSGGPHAQPGEYGGGCPPRAVRRISVYAEALEGRIKKYRMA